MSTRILSALCLAAVIAASSWAHAGPGEKGHSHGDHKGASYEGHAAALGEPGDPKAKARTVNIRMTDDMRFHPATVTVSRGETIRFIVANAGDLKHEMTLGTIAELKQHAALMEKFPEMEHDDPNSITVEPGASKAILWKFTKSGSFDFACLVPGHMEGGMKGKINVK